MFGWYIDNPLYMRTFSTSTVNAGESVAKKRKITSCGDIKTRADFDQAFGPSGYTLDPWKYSRMQIGHWGLKSNIIRISEWLRQVAPGLVSSFGLIARNSEVALYPLLTGLLLPIIELSSFAVITTTTGISIETDAVPEIAQQISMAHSKAEPAAQYQQDRCLETQDAAQVSVIVAEVIREVERIVKCPGMPFTGRVELIVGKPTKESDTTAPHATIVCKPEKLIYLGLPASGYYQTCANMILSGDARFGVYTNYNEWIFLELLPDKKIVHSGAFNFIATNYEKFNPDCLEVLAHLFQILEVPLAINLPDRVAAVQREKEAATAALLEHVK